MPRRLELREVGPAWLTEVGIQHGEARLRIRVVVESSLLVEEVEHVGHQHHTLGLMNVQPVVGMHGCEKVDFVRVLEAVN